jgi:hypothetical protein
LVIPAAAAVNLAVANELSEISTEVINASGLFLARVTVCAPTPQPASRTLLAAG